VNLLVLEDAPVGQRCDVGVPAVSEGTAALVSSMLDGTPMSAEFAGFLHERTDGIPLAVEESVRLLCDRTDLSSGQCRTEAADGAGSTAGRTSGRRALASSVSASESMDKGFALQRRHKSLNHDP